MEKTFFFWPVKYHVAPFRASSKKFPDCWLDYGPMAKATTTITT
jgi:hypothetical protein